MTEIVISIQGMNCGHCVKAVERAVDALPGILSREVRVGSARIAHDESKIDESTIRRAIEGEGYKVVRS